MRPSFALILALLANLGAARYAFAADVAPQAADHEFFEKRIRPIFVTHCYECHSAASKKLGGNLRLDTRSGILRGGDTGPALIPRDPKQSLLLTAVRYDDDSLQMPPAGKLPAEAIADLERWIRDGAVDPRTDEPAAPAAAAVPDWQQTLATRRDWWSLQPVKDPPLPTSQTVTGANPIDRFIAARLEKDSLQFAPQADARTLIRRLSLVLTGLPPAPADVAEFAAAYDSTVTPADVEAASRLANRERVYTALVDKLLASPHFGERWARHWMDVVRFSETHGNEWNYEVHHAWRYRDYLIRAFNADVPYDQFVREHIAGDLLPQPRLNAAERINESVIGTAFYRFGEVNHDDCIGLRQIGYDLADNQLDTLTKAFQATTVACARCHDHKIDAISARDYHATLGILRSSRLVSHTIDLPGANDERLAKLRALKKQIRSQLADAWKLDLADFPDYMAAARTGNAKREDPKNSQPLDAARVERWKKFLALKDAPPGDPYELWRTMAREPMADEQAFVAKWDALIATQRKLTKERAEDPKKFTVWTRFNTGYALPWEKRGLGLRSSESGEPVIASAGDAFVSNLLPAGFHTHADSDKLNGTLRSPLLPTTGKYISFQVIGGKSSAVRLVSNHCQLNYKNYRALTSDEPTWVTFPMPEDRAELRTYAELMTMLDNPKFPDQLSALGGDKANYRLPWDQAAGERRSHFGIMQVVIHDDPQPPQPTLDHLYPFLDKVNSPSEMADLEGSYALWLEILLEDWKTENTQDNDLHWLALLLKHDLLSNSAKVVGSLGLEFEDLRNIGKLVAEYRKLEAEIESPRVIPGMADFGPGFDQPVFIRGDWQRKGPPAPRGYLEVLGADAFKSPKGSGRLQLAERIASADNPLTARVMVNRVWHHLFGSGLVRTVDDFGRIGDRPSHPELLDHLASRFVADGWSLKKLIRQIVLSQTFRSAASHSDSLMADKATEFDPDNRLLSHYPARRLEAEAIRDSILAASGRLDPQLYGPSVQPFREQPNNDRRLFPGPLDGAGRRSIYIKFNLMEAPKFLSAFNLPGGKVAQGKRDATQVPAQALALMNDPFVLQQAQVWAERLCSNPFTSNLTERIDAMFQTAYGRKPTSEEQAAFEQMITELAKLHGTATDQVLKSVPIWRDAAHALFTTEEFLYVP
jgi:cytochrome c553